MNAEELIMISVDDHVALRAEAGDHDVSIKSADKGRFEKSVGIELGKFTATA